MDLNVECIETNRENVEIPRENDQVEKESAMVVQGCNNYKILSKRKVLMDILDYEEDLERQRSIKSKNYKGQWKFKYP